MSASVATGGLPMTTKKPAAVRRKIPVIASAGTTRQATNVSSRCCGSDTGLDAISRRKSFARNAGHHAPDQVAGRFGARDDAGAASTVQHRDAVGVGEEIIE